MDLQAFINSQSADVPATMKNLAELGFLQQKQIQTLYHRVTALEKRRTMSFVGSHDPGREYKNGDVVQRANGLFVCLSDTQELPGNSPMWRRIGDAK